MLSYANKRDELQLQLFEDQLNSLINFDAHFKCYSVTTEDNVTLNTISFTTSNRSSGKYIINFMGNNKSCFDRDFIPQIIADVAEAEDVTSIAFDYRGTGTHFCGPGSKYDLVQDGIAQVQALLDQNVLPENIRLSGHSLGGAIAIEVAAYFHRRGQKIYVFADRTFASTQSYLNGHMLVIAEAFLNPFARLYSYQKQLEAGINDNTALMIASGQSAAHVLLLPVLVVALLFIVLFYLVISLLLHFSGWNINLGPCIEDIPADYREYIVVKAPEGQNYFDDEVIPYAGSLHNHPFLRKERERNGENLNSRMFFSRTANPRPHLLSLSALENDQNQTAAEMRYAFVLKN